jgi:L-fucose isomerase-like protein
MKTAIYTITSPLHDEQSVNSVSSGFLREIEDAMGFTFDFRGTDFTAYGTDALDIIYVRTGGTEGIFKELFPRLGGRILLLTSGKSNSLAASLEILSYLRQQGRNGEVIHGSASYIASRISTLAKVEEAKRALKGCRLGCIGEPSDWLISSAADKDAVKEKLGIEIVDIPIEELIESVLSAKELELSDDVISLRDNILTQAPETVRQYAEGAVRIYAALKEMVKKYSLSGLTLRCFDLLKPLGNTGCLALALLNAEGIPAGCEGDMPALLTMTVGNALTGQCGFQANPSHIDPQTGEILLAHCTVPMNMIGKYSFNTHFESGIGIALHGELPEGDCTIFKLSGNLSRAFCCKAELLRNQYEKNLCRTQIIMKSENHNEVTDYFLNNPVGNHHIVFTGNHKELFNAFCKIIV